MLGLCRKLIGLFGMFIMGTLMLFIRYATFGKGVDFNRLCIAPIGSRLILRVIGVRVQSDIVQSDDHVIYMFNHNSFFDILLIPVAKLKNTRFIISEAVQSILPLHLCNLGIDVLYIPTKNDPERRAAFFRRVTDELAQKKYNVICSPEGQHTFIHGLAAFNDGVFKMAIESQTAIQCLFIDIPRDANPLESLDMKACCVRMYDRDRFEVSGWTTDQTASHKLTVRAKFLEYYSSTYGDLGESAVQN